MKISARNVFKGTISRLEPGAVNAEVEVDVGGGNRLVAMVTSASVRSLGLAVGKPVVALVKSSSILILVEGDGVQLTARNRLDGTVTQITDGAVEAGVSIALAGGVTVHAVITHESVLALGLKVGGRASAVFKASAVILGTSA